LLVFSDKSRKSSNTIEYELPKYEDVSSISSTDDSLQQTSPLSNLSASNLPHPSAISSEGESEPSIIGTQNF